MPNLKATPVELAKVAVRAKLVTRSRNEDLVDLEIVDDEQKQIMGHNLSMRLTGPDVGKISPDQNLVLVVHPLDPLA